MNIHTPGGAQQLGFTIPLTKIDEEKRLVYGVAALEQKDRTNEILDYETSKPNFVAWSKSFEDATGGLSKGNVRIMHTKEVAGSLREFECDDHSKTFKVCAHIVDDQAWRKVLSGAFTGFSVGGGYGKSSIDPDGCKRYEAKPNEISLVDRPCIPGAQFAELVKADGIVQQILLHPVAVEGFAKAWAARPVGFAEAWDARPVSFAEAWEQVLTKDYRHPREHDGQFSSKTGERIGRTLGVAAGAVGGAALAHTYGGRIGGAVAAGAVRGATKLARYADRKLNGAVHGPSYASMSADANLEASARYAGTEAGNSRRGKQVGAVVGAGVGYGIGGFGGRQLDNHGRKGRAAEAATRKKPVIKQ